ncbi:MAG: hypothetical protein ABIO24_02375 [Saprospiraceae bacterium]
MPILRLLILLVFAFTGCYPAGDTGRQNSPCANTSLNADSTANKYHSGRGALLATRFASLEELKSVIQLEYHPGTSPADSLAPENGYVSLRHCSSGREVTGILATGISEGDIVKAKREGAFGERFKLLYGSPAAVANRKDLEKIFNLSRLRFEWFGEGDVAFFEIAESLVAHINTPDLAYLNPRDSSEKGYINSFNHLTAQTFVTSCFSEELADFIGDAHERYRHPELITGKFTEAQIKDLDEGPVDNYVDLINNEWGQELGKQLKAKYGINQETNWTPELLANYLNDIASYYSWAFQIGFAPYRPADEVVRRFSVKINAIMQGHYYYQ